MSEKPIRRPGARRRSRWPGPAGRPRRRADRRGLVLVAAVGVLGVISLMGLAFATVMRLEAHAARNYTNAVRAEFVARSGIEDAISRLRVMARMGTEQPYDEDGKVAAWYTWRGTEGNGGWKVSFPADRATNWIDDDNKGGIDDEEPAELSYADWVSGTFVDGGDNYTLRIQDAASKINVNAGDNLGVILDNLCRAVGPPLRAAKQEALVPRWFGLKMAGHEESRLRTNKYLSEYSRLDVWDQQDLFYRQHSSDPNGDTRPVCEDDTDGIGVGAAVYGDGYAIAGYRARKPGGFLTIDEVRDALTYIERNPDSPTGGGVPDLPEEQMEIDAKFAALQPYITTDSWADTDQCGYGKFEIYEFDKDPDRQLLIDRNKTWNVMRNYDPMQAEWMGELSGCYVAMLNGIGQGQIKRITRNTTDTIYLDNRVYANSQMAVKPTHETSYIIVGKDFADPEVQRLYIKQPLSFHRAPVNVNTASDKVLVAVLMGLQTDWGPAGYRMYPKNADVEDSRPYAEAANVVAGVAGLSICPSVISLGRDTDNNAFIVHPYFCPNRNCEVGCFFCNYGRQPARSSGKLNEAHMVAWQILREREQTKSNDKEHDGHGPFRGWDDLYFRVFRKFEIGKPQHVEHVWRAQGKSLYAKLQRRDRSAIELEGKRGIARLCMANFNSNTDILKFNPNLEWINRWGPNFTDLYVPFPQLLNEELKHPQTGELIGGNVKLRVRPGELLDKTDLNVGTTEFSFDSGGVYEVESIGRVYGEGGVVSERKFNALIKIYDVWRESTQREFARGLIMKAEGEAGVPQPSGMFGPVFQNRIRKAGQVAVDRYEVKYDPSGNPYEVTGPPEHKALCTYPEPITPVGYLTSRGSGASGGRPAALNVGLSGVPPAGYDGCIMLATNDMAKNDELQNDVIFYTSFTGDLAADVSAGESEPKTYSTVSHSTWHPNDPQYQPLDYFMDLNKSGRLDYDDNGVREKGVGLLGIIDSPKDVVDMENTEAILRDGTVVREGEGPDGDLRPDGMVLDETGTDLLDGSYEFDASGNMNNQQGTVTLWLKPMWHHGTRMRSTLPLGYFRPETLEKNGAEYIYNYLDKGCHVAMRKYTREWYTSVEGGNKAPLEVSGSEAGTAASRYKHNPWPWPCEFQMYNPDDASLEHEYKRGIVGYVRDRFEHEIFNAANIAPGAGANDWRLLKAGDYKNSHGDLDMPFGGDYFITVNNIRNNYIFSCPGGAPPNASLICNFENDWDMFSCSYLPGWLYADSKPFYFVAPFRWHFLGLTWNPNNEFDRNGVANCGGMNYERTCWRGEGWPIRDRNWNHGSKGQPLEPTIAYGFPYGNDYDSDIKPWNAVVNPGEPLIDGHWNEIPDFNDKFPQTGLKYNGGGDYDGGGAPIVPDYLPDRTAEHNLSDIVQQRPWIDTMRTWGTTPHDNRPQQGYRKDRYENFNYPDVPPGIQTLGAAFETNPNALEMRMRSWAYEQWGTGTERQRWPANPSHMSAFGVNRGRGDKGHAYQRLYSGTYGTFDELVIYNFTPDPQTPSGFDWPYKVRSAGRYYMWKDRPGEGEAPWFLSQTLFDSEMAQSFAFATEAEETDVTVELGTVRWTVFTPYYCLDIPSERLGYERDRTTGLTDSRRSQWQFDNHGYFFDVAGDDPEDPIGVTGSAIVTQMWRPRPEHWAMAPDADRETNGKRSRISSQRGCRVQIVTGASDDGRGRGEDTYPSGDKFYDDPEAWEPIVGGEGRHLKQAPGDIRYKVTFELSQLENREAGSHSDAALIDSPVFDDITITYLRRPKVLEWRE